MSKRKAPPQRQAAAPPVDVAIIGIGVVLPRAGDAEAFWENNLRGESVVTEVPPRYWDWRQYYSANRREREKPYSRWGAFLEEIPFDPIRERIAPASMRSIPAQQLLMMEAARRALADAGYESAEGLDRENTAVIMGLAGGHHMLNQRYIVRAQIPQLFGTVSDAVLEQLPKWTSDTFPGILGNILTGRVSNRYDFGGVNYVVDAACASSLAALELAVNELVTGRCNVAVAGGVDVTQSPYSYILFCRTQAFSPTGQLRAFDKKADGIVAGSGLVVLILKRLADAEAAGDRIYAVIKGVGGASDGHGTSLTAPRSIGQRRALDKAYRSAGFSPATIGLYEAHGTGTSRGDQVELEAVLGLLRDHRSAPASCAITTAKSLYGHAIAAAGAIGIAKAALALYHKTLPPHFNVDDPVDELRAADSPLYLLQQPVPWLRPADHPRRAGVSCYGFGGTNFHVVLEEHEPAAAPRGAAAWPAELFVWTAGDREALRDQLLQLRQYLAKGFRPPLRDLAFTLAGAVVSEWRAAAAIAAADREGLVLALEAAIAELEGRGRGALPPQVHLRVLGEDETRHPGTVAFLFPGQGSQYPGMAREAALYFGEVAAALEAADAALGASYGRPLSQFIHPPAAFDEAERQRRREELANTHVAQPAIGAVECGGIDLLRRLGVRPDMVAGHSYGEYTALHAAGVLTREQLLRLSELRGRLMGQPTAGPAGTMAAVKAAREDVARVLEGRSDVVVANHNTPLQTVISGSVAGVAEVCRVLEAQGIAVRPLPVSGAFHSRLMEKAQKPLAAAIAAAQLQPPGIPVYSNVTAAAYPGDTAAIREILTRQMLSTVEFTREIEAMHRDGARVFVEVGPGQVLGGLVRQTLADLPHHVVSIDGPEPGLKGLLAALGALFVRGLPVAVGLLFENRGCRTVDFGATVDPAQPVVSPTTWWIDGMSVRPEKETTMSESETRPGAGEAAADDAPASCGPTGSVPAPVPERLVPPEQPAPASRPELLRAYELYQQTMREFLQLHERVLSQVLGGSPPAAPSVAVAAAFALPAAAGVAPAAPAAPRPAAAPAPPAAATMDREALTRELLQLVSDRTGYPPEMLGLDQDMEAELGIDSIKRIEIFGAFRERLPAALRGAMQASAERFNQVRTLGGLVIALSEGVAAAPGAVAPQPGAATLAPPDGGEPRVALGRERLVELTLAVVSELTGYPTEMLGLDQDIEAELGIDSIKRVEILGALRGRLPQGLGAAVQKQTGCFTQARTLGAVVDQLLAAEAAVSSAPAAPAATPAAGSPGSAAGAAPAEIGRYVVASRPLPLPPAAAAALSGLYLVAEDSLGVAPLVAAALRDRGAAVALLSGRALASPEAVQRGVEAARTLHGPVAGIVHLAGLSGEPLPESLELWRRQTQLQTKSLFQMLQACGTEVRAARGRILAASNLGGDCGADVPPGPGLPCAGGNAGLLKTVSIEWPEVRAKTVDFDDAPPAAIAAAIVAELLAAPDAPEIGYRAGTRRAFALVPAPVTPGGEPTTRLFPDWVVLAIGGARGITAAIVEELLLPGMRLVLVGRSVVPAEEPEHLRACADAGAVRQALTEEARRGGGRVTPAQLEQRLRGVLKDREIRRTLERYRAAGATVEYHAVDMRQEAAATELLEDVYRRFGRIDAVVQGAGVIEDKLLADKSAASFDRVFDTKVDSLYLLQRLLRPAPLQLAVLFGSVAGRTGNRGQGDYAAANAVLNVFAWRLMHEWSGTRVISLNWGPWESSGMASEAVNRQFRERGVIPVSPQAGRRFVARELRDGRRTDVELIAGIFLPAATSGALQPGQAPSSGEAP